MIENYIKYFESFLLNYYRIILGNGYDKKLLMPFIEKYVDVRYYNNSVYSRGYSFINKLNAELKNVAKGIINEESALENEVKEIFTLFGYILYIDDCSEYDSLNSLIKTIGDDINLTSEKQEELKSAISDFIKARKDFFAIYEDKNFNIDLKRVARNVKKVEIKQNCKLSPIYSDWAIDKAYNSGTVLENKQYLLYLMLSGYILKNTIELNFSEQYIVDFPESLFAKEKKINKYTKVLDNKVVKPRVHFRFSYATYTKNKDKINTFINNGFNVAIVLDETYDENLKILDIFSYVFIYEKYEYYDIVIENKDNINTKIISQ